MTTLNKVYDIQAPSAKILAVAITKDGTLCAAGDRDGYTHIIDLSNGTIVRKLGQHVEFVYALAIDPDTNHLITTGKDKSLREWDMASGRFICDYAGIFSTSATSRSMATQNLKATTKSHTKTVTAIACAAGGIMATGGQDARVKYWVKGEPFRSFEWHEGPISCVQFQPETGTLFSSSKDKSIRSWNINNGSMLHKYTGHRDEIVAFGFASSDRMISVDASGCVLAWNTDQEKSIAQIFYAPGQVQTALLDPSRQLIILGLEDGRLVGADISGNEFKPAVFTIDDHASAVRSIAIHDDLVVSSDNNGKVKVWKIEG